MYLFVKKCDIFAIAATMIFALVKCWFVALNIDNSDFKKVCRGDWACAVADDNF